MIIKVKNNQTINAPKTYLSDDTSSSASTLAVKNTNAFSANYAVQIGDTGSEKTEIKIISSISGGTAIGLSSNTTYDHAVDTPLYLIKFDQLIFKRSTSGTAGTATAITNGTVNITPDEPFTQFDDTSGASTYAYKTSFFNSSDSTESSDSDWLVPTGFKFYALAKIRERTKRKLYSANYIKDDEIIDDWINEWLEIMNNEAIEVDKEYSLGSVDVTCGTSGLGTITEEDFKEIKRLWVTYNGTDYFTANKLSMNNFYPDEEFNTSHPYYYYQGDNVFGIKPDESATASVIYYKMHTTPGSRLQNDADELPVSMKAYTTSFVNYALSQAYYMDEKPVMGDRFLQLAQGLKNDFIRHITPRAKTGVQYITVVDALDGDNTSFDLL